MNKQYPALSANDVQKLIKMAEEYHHEGNKRGDHLAQRFAEVVLVALSQPKPTLFLDGNVTAGDSLKIAAIVHDFDQPLIPADFKFDPEQMNRRQLHAGLMAKPDYKGDENDPLWHTDIHGLFWCGQWYHRTPAQLEAEALTTLKHVRELYAEHGKS